MKIGILALQGAFIEHKHSLDALGVESFEIRQKKDIEKPFDGLIIPGGESTVIGKLLHKLDLYEPIKNMIENGMPVFGTCAGLIVLAKNIEGEQAHIGTMDITVDAMHTASKSTVFPKKSLSPKYRINRFRLYLSVRRGLTVSAIT